MDVKQAILSKMADLPRRAVEVLKIKDENLRPNIVVALAHHRDRDDRYGRRSVEA